MSSKGIVDNTNIFFSGDKGISVGENSKVTILNSSIISSFIGMNQRITLKLQ